MSRPRSSGGAIKIKSTSTSVTFAATSARSASSPCRWASNMSWMSQCRQSDMRTPFVPLAATQLPSTRDSHRQVRRELPFWHQRHAWPTGARLYGLSGSRSHLLSRERSISDGLIYHGPDHPLIFPARRSRRLRHPHHRQFLARVAPPIGAECPGPGEIADGTGAGCNSWSDPDRNRESETIIGVDRTAVTQLTFDVRPELIRQHVFDRLAAKDAVPPNWPLLTSMETKRK